MTSTGPVPIIENPDTDRRLADIFFPYTQERTALVRADGDRFAYYTSAEAAKQILTSRQIWLRNALVMNDFKEIAHGHECLVGAYNGPAGQALNAALESCFPGMEGEVKGLFNGLMPAIYRDTYLFCVSEHAKYEDSRGRLSMWRGCGGSTGVALILNGAVMHATSDVLGAYSSPVFYGNAPEFSQEIARVAEQIRGNAAYVKGLGKDVVINAVLTMMTFSVLCTKHPGFREEREWRVIASPSLFPGGRQEFDVEVVRGVPQQVVKVSLENAPDQGLIGLALPELIDRVIIGPCEFPFVTALAFQRLLAKAGVPDPESRVILTDIPLRHKS